VVNPNMSFDPSYRRIPAGYAQQQWPPDHYQNQLAHADGFDAFDGNRPQHNDGQWPYAGAAQPPEPNWNQPAQNQPTQNQQNWNQPDWNQQNWTEQSWEEPSADRFDDGGYLVGHGQPQYNQPQYDQPQYNQPRFGDQPPFGDEPYYTGEPDFTAGRGFDGGRHQLARTYGPGVIVGAVMGLLGAAVAIGVATLAAAFFRPQASPIIAVGEAFIDRTPPALKNFAVEKFGENDKTMLLLGMYVTIALLAMAIGVFARKRVMVGVVGVAVFGLFGSFVAYTRPASRPSDVIPSIIGGIAGVFALLWLAHAATAEVERG
jgi:hypothetical protein